MADPHDLRRLSPVAAQRRGTFPHSSLSDYPPAPRRGGFSGRPPASGFVALCMEATVAAWKAQAGEEIDRTRLAAAARLYGRECEALEAEIELFLAGRIDGAALLTAVVAAMGARGWRGRADLG